MMRYVLTALTSAAVLVAGLGAAAQQKPAAGASQTKVTVYKSPT
jgi:hypothetical protein